MSALTIGLDNAQRSWHLSRIGGDGIGAGSRTALAGAASITDLLAGSARRAPGAVALCAPGRPDLTYDGLVAQTAGVASALRRAGARNEDRVALLVPNGPEAMSAFLAVSTVAGCAPLNPGYREQELEFFLTDLGVSTVLVADTLDSPIRAVAGRMGVPVLELHVEPGAPAGCFTLIGLDLDGSGSLPDTDGEHVALLLHTSGTTARPKLVPLRHANLTASAASIAATLALTPADRCLNVMPLFHIHGLVAAGLASLTAGAGVVCTDGFHAVRFVDWLEELAPTWYTAVPTMHQSVLAQMSGRESASLRHALRFIRSSSSPLPPTVAHGLESVFGVPVIEAYGMTEAAHQMASNPLPPGVRKAGSVGLAAGAEIVVIDEDGSVVPAGEVGEVAVSGPGVFAGYEANPEANREAFAGDFFRTGDLGVVDEDGYLFLRGRLKEIINRGGEKISPREIDEALLEHPAVAEAVAFGVPDDRLGEDVGAAVVLREGATADAGELQEHVARSLADFKVPRRLVVVDAIPKGPTGKQQRMGLAARLGLDRPSDESGDAPYEAPRTPLESALGALWERVLGADRVGRDDDFFQLGGDSILGAELITRLSEAGIERTDVPLAVLAWAPTVASLAAWLETGERASAGALVPVRSDGALPPLYFVHGGDGDVVALAGLARFLPDRPFVCVRSPALDGEAPSRDVASIAGRYADEIAASAGQGAIAVGGICTGGPIALEVGRELSARGREVGALVLVDPTAAPRRGDGPLAVLRTHLESSGGSRGLVRTSRARAAKLARRLGALPALSAPEERARRSEEAMAAAVRKHRLVPYPGPMTVIHSDGFPTPRPLWEWVAAGGLEWHEIEGPHSSLLRGDRIDVLGEVLAASLEGEPTAAR